jgi:hypothetical protein
LGQKVCVAAAAGAGSAAAAAAGSSAAVATSTRRDVLRFIGWFGTSNGCVECRPLLTLAFGKNQFSDHCSGISLAFLMLR